ncbi:AAA ATPase domain-containing protein [Cavenderia fasciculata]|uniref:AAA ATPase domain-containing protein n=1 Tax=Cavenderia fasciculata TaxID=261658 RepID=F4Q4Z3_CACFS|nr:AAA ATPase domain-containing protein [Cavenderia fasciculata]EGG17099.1 AAA ATPase domain-containing protein [Cavenderia fasciculata]|eukprot:XP_004355583.1 AAA ATPase domain-containing protein [Cavenderia fasciculata]
MIKLIVQDVNQSQASSSSSNGSSSQRRGVAYLCYKQMQTLSLSIGDLVLIQSIDSSDSSIDDSNENNGCLLTCWPVKKLSLNYILIDNFIRDNIKVNIGDSIQLTKIISSSSDIILLNASTVYIECLNVSYSSYIEQLNQHGLLSTLVSSQLSGYYFTHGNTFNCCLNGRQTKFKINSIDNNSKQQNIFSKILDQTKFKLNNNQNNNQVNNNVSPVSMIGGLSNQMKEIKEILSLAFEKREMLNRFGIKPPRGVLLYGPPGTGKTMLARTVASESGCTLFTMNGADILDKYYGVTEKAIQSIFRDAAQRAPSIIFIDELDALCPKRDQATTEIEKRLVGCLLTLLDGINSDERVVVIGCTNRPDALDGSLRRPGRLDREIEIGIPNAINRQDILGIICSRIPNQLTPADIGLVASKTHGYVGADLESLVKESCLIKFHKLIKNGEILNDKEEDKDASSQFSVDLSDMMIAMEKIRPSSMREVIVEVPKVKWEDIGGQDDIKEKLKEAIEWPLKHPAAFERMGIRPPKGILLYGPPGCSKTLLAKALATESGLNFIAVKGPELISKWVGESERAVRDIFKKARQNSPSILFFDEMDGLATERSGQGSGAIERVVSQLLTEMDGIQPLTNVTIVAATNRPDIIDKAILRAGRIDRILYISPPDQKARKEIFKIHLLKVPHSNDIDIDLLSNITDGYSGAEVTSICKEASVCAMKEDLNIEKVEMRHFQSAIGLVKKGITKEMIEFYDNYQKQSKLQKL